MTLLALALSAAKTAPEASNDGPVIAVGTGTVTAGPVNIFVTGGTPPYTYFTSYLDGNPCTIVGASTSQPSFQRTGVSGIDQFQGTVRCVVTDNRSRVASTDVEWFITGGA